MKTHVNLLPRTLQQQQLFGKIRTTLLRMAMASLLLGGCNFAWIYQQYSQSCHQLAEMENVVRPLTELDASNQLLASEISTLQNRLQECNQLEQATTPISLIGFIGKSFAAADRPIRLDSLRVDFSQAAPKPQAAKDAAPDTSINIVMVGTAAEDAPISAVLMHLRATGIFDSVELEGSQATSQADQQRRSFQIRCQL